LAGRFGGAPHEDRVKKARKLRNALAVGRICPGFLADFPVLTISNEKTNIRAETA
jgi:hypothetical protein